MKVVFFARSLRREPGGIQRATRGLVRHLSEHVDLTLVENPYHRRSPRFLPYAVSAANELTLSDKSVLAFLGDMSLTPLLPFLPGRFHSTVALAFGLDLLYPLPGYRQVLRMLGRKLDRVLCISQATAAICESFGFSPSRILITGLGIDVPNDSFKSRGDARQWLERVGYSPLGNGPVLLSVGRLIPRKGIHWFLRHVFSRLCSTFPDMKYVIVGEGRMRPTIEQLVKTRGWEDTVVMLGAIRDADVQAWYSASDLLVVPNIPMRFDMEGLGLVALEASARGLPVVASAVDGLHDAVVDGITGYLVEPENPGAFFHGIHSLLTQDAVRRRMSRNGPKVAEEQYAWDSVVTRYVQVLSSLDQQVFSS